MKKIIGVLLMEKQEVFVGDAPQDNGLGEYFVLREDWEVKDDARK